MRFYRWKQLGNWRDVATDKAAWLALTNDFVFFVSEHAM